jgi:hypothetical protein
LRQFAALERQRSAGTRHSRCVVTARPGVYRTHDEPSGLTFSAAHEQKIAAAARTSEFIGQAEAATRATLEAHASR